MKTMSEEFTGYLGAVYQRPLPQQQVIDLERAFFGGAMVMMNKLEAAADIPGERQCWNAIEALRAEVILARQRLGQTPNHQ